jgi:hypothetical protein
MAAANHWASDICGCCSVKDCGCGCCCKLYVGSPCIWGAALEKAGLGGCIPCCLGISCFPCCTVVKARMDVAAKYGIKEDLPMNLIYTCCCTCCSQIQVLNQVHSSPCPIHCSNHLVGLPDVSPWSNLAYHTQPHSPTPARTHGYSVRKLLSPMCPQIMVKENLTYGCCGVEPSPAGAPEIEAMER